MSDRYVAVFATILLLVGGVGGVAAIDSPQDGAAQETQQGAAACDYEELFDQTIDSVVSVQTRAGQGSGFVYQVGANATGGNATTDENGTADGAVENASTTNVSYVVTNAHVVSGAESVEIQFDDGEYRSGDVVGTSSYADLAVVRVDETPGYVGALSVAEADPDRGEKVAALGNPLGFEQTITHGIVSGVNRSMPTDLGFRIPNVVQTDAPISPGNSGGPLMTCDGSVVGVNTAGIASAQAENIGFAVSASIVEQVVPALVADSEYDYPYLGVSTAAVTPAVAEANDLNRSDGVMVASVVDDGPASDRLQGRTGFTSVSGQVVPVGGDVVLSIDGQSIETSEDLGTYLVTEYEPGDTVEMAILRDGERRTVEVTLGERPSPESA